MIMRIPDAISNKLTSKKVVLPWDWRRARNQRYYDSDLGGEPDKHLNPVTTNYQRPATILFLSPPPPRASDLLRS
jgi:hypothetical protein